MKERAYQIHRVPEFRDWFDEQTEKARVQIDDRLSKIQDEGYFGDHKSVSDDDEILELKWKNGRRIYFAHIPERKILILLGGNKNGQDKDIRKAKSLYKKYTA
ncbi:MAG: type II toxin-antitoxin system RelE/ParE family toxin [Chlamydiales bacterium]